METQGGVFAPEKVWCAARGLCACFERGGLARMSEDEDIGSEEPASKTGLRSRRRFRVGLIPP